MFLHVFHHTKVAGTEGSYFLCTVFLQAESTGFIPHTGTNNTELKQPPTHPSMNTHKSPDG